MHEPVSNPKMGRRPSVERPGTFSCLHHMAAVQATLRLAGEDGILHANVQLNASDPCTSYPAFGSKLVLSAPHRLAEEGDLLGGAVPGHLRERRSMSTLQMETIHEDGTDDLHHVAEVLRDEFGVRPEELPIDVRSQVRVGRV